MKFFWFFFNLLIFSYRENFNHKGEKLISKFFGEIIIYTNNPKIIEEFTIPYDFKNHKRNSSTQPYVLEITTSSIKPDTILSLYERNYS